MMLVRIVKLILKKENIDVFEQLFLQNRNKIRGFEGCSFLELYQDNGDPRIFFTYSHWENADCLEAYRNSKFFNGVWSKTKILFDENPEAWSVSKI